MATKPSGASPDKRRKYDEAFKAEALIAENLCLTLQDLGYAALPACHTYAQAEAVLTRPNGSGADLVLLDINLGSPDPARTGLALARHLSGPAAPPFIFLTAYADLDTIRQATRLRPGSYLIKPVNGSTLFAAIQTALEYHRTAAATPPAQAPDPAAYKTGYPLRGSLAYVLDQLLPVALRPHFVRVNRRVSLNVAYITAYDEEFVYCGLDRYENGGTAQQQLQALKL